MTKTQGWLIAAALTLGCSAGPALADRAPTPLERARIERVMVNAGYITWEEIELDDGRWAIDGAIGRDGLASDVRLDPITLRIVGVEPD